MTMIRNQVPQPTVAELHDMRIGLSLAAFSADDEATAKVFRNAIVLVGELPLGTKIKTFHYKRRAGE